ncbi:MAG: UTP--glucose-1-phosphate uridylyltransferase [Firmicutes bacterium]|nr:UTP--glucose-1-phosphate uridylyltransferase [Bacillota bacterium]
MNKITKAVIPCGGLGTRFLPITKTIPKELLPVIDMPVLGYIVAEAVDSGITDVLIVLGRGKEAIRDYFSNNSDLEKVLRDAGKTEYADMLLKIGRGARIRFAVQQKPLGSGDAILYAEEFAAGEPFALAWGDDLIYSESNPVMGQLMAAYGLCGANIIGVQQILTDNIVKYGVADVWSQITNADDNRVTNGDVPMLGEYRRSGGNRRKDASTGSPIAGVERRLGEDRRINPGGLYTCFGIVEKPPLDKLPSRFAALGRYILTPEIFDVIRNTPKGSNGELQLTDSLNSLARAGKVCVCDFIGKRYDMGDKLGSVLAVVDYAARDKVFGAQFKAFLKDYVKGF